ncbi:MAG: hypothetical protein OEZ02_04385 [Anaerolineae bacterium]|nr:hypothetical protein [Anaerolineae bacterium]
MLTFVFLVEKWEGKIITETDETIDARFFHENEFPELQDAHLETLQDVRQFSGQVFLK